VKPRAAEIELVPSRSVVFRDVDRMPSRTVVVSVVVVSVVVVSVVVAMTVVFVIHHSVKQPSAHSVHGER
jgi:hypothetical protein